MIPLSGYSNITSPGEGVRVVPIISEKSDRGERGMMGCTSFAPPPSPIFLRGEGSKFPDGGI